MRPSGGLIAPSRSADKVPPPGIQTLPGYDVKKIPSYPILAVWQVQNPLHVLRLRPLGILSRQANISPVEALYSRLFVGRQLYDLSPRLVCTAAAIDGAVVIDGNGIVRGIGCIFETGRMRTAADGTLTRAAVFGSKDGVALKISQDGEMSHLHSNGKNRASIFSPVWQNAPTHRRTANGAA